MLPPSYKAHLIGTDPLIRLTRSVVSLALAMHLNMDEGGGEMWTRLITPNERRGRGRPSRLTA
jgi:hypothetical protein